jgi:hypothetical protein
MRHVLFCSTEILLADSYVFCACAQMYLMRYLFYFISLMNWWERRLFQTAVGYLAIRDSCIAYVWDQHVDCSVFRRLLFLLVTHHSSSISFLPPRAENIDYLTQRWLIQLQRLRSVSGINSNRKMQTEGKVRLRCILFVTQFTRPANIWIDVTANITKHV